MRWHFIGFAILIVFLLSILRFVLAIQVGTTVVTTAAQTELTQSTYRWYTNVDALTPTSPEAAENTGIETPADGTVLRLRINVQVTGLQLDAGARFKIQFAQDSTSSFSDVSTSTGAWIFHDNSSVADGQTIVDTVLSDSDTGESYEESNPSATSPNDILASQRGEWDWVIKSNSADTGSVWYFQMIYSSGTALDGYTNYPTLTAVTAAPEAAAPIIITGGGVTPPKPPKPPVPRPPSPCDNLALQAVDLSGDCLVDIIDLSILLFYYGETGPEIARYDFNNNSAVDFPDVSVMMYYWTG